MIVFEKVCKEYICPSMFIATLKIAKERKKEKPPPPPKPDNNQNVQQRIVKINVILYIDVGILYSY